MWLPLQDTKGVAHNNNAADTLVFFALFFSSLIIPTSLENNFFLLPKWDFTIGTFQCLAFVI